jgi:hypothetical protein
LAILGKITIARGIAGVVRCAKAPVTGDKFFDIIHFPGRSMPSW